MISHQKVVNYARGLFNINSSIEEIHVRQKDLELLSHLITDYPKILTILSYPQLTIDKKIALIEQSLSRSLDPFVKQLLAVLIKRRITSMIRRIALEYHKLVVYGLQELDVEVTTAEPLTDQEKQILKEKLEKRLQKKIEMSEVVDPSLLGGFSVLIHDQMLDLSIRGKLNNLKKQLLKAKI